MRYCDVRTFLDERVEPGTPTVTVSRRETLTTRRANPHVALDLTTCYCFGRDSPNSIAVSTLLARSLPSPNLSLRIHHACPPLPIIQ